MTGTQTPRTDTPRSEARTVAPRVAAAIVLAAGEGTRMRSATPKVLHTIGGRSLLGHAVGAVRSIGPAELVVMVGRSRPEVAAHLAAIDSAAVAVVQDPPAGTGHAVRVALDHLPELSGTVVVVPGDAPLLSAPTLASLAERQATTRASAVLLTARVPDPAGYGRVLRGEAGEVVAIVEDADATAEQRAVREVNTSVYAFDAVALRTALGGIGRDNAQGEEYLPDVVRLMVEGGAAVEAVVLDDWREAAGVNDRAQLAAAGALLRDRIAGHWMRAGVTIVDPATTWIDVDARLEPDSVVLPNTMLLGSTTVAAGATVGPNCSLRDTTVAAGAVVRDATCERAEIGPEATVGPYTYLRPGTRLLRGAKAGGFVEMKNAVIGADSKVPHLSYVGDATIGERTNVGAATVFVNYDGVGKHRTQVGDDVRIGSDNMLVAPVHIGDGAYTGAGTVVRADVPPGALGVSMGPQRNIEGWVARRRPGTPAAEAAARAIGGGGTIGVGGGHNTEGDTGNETGSDTGSGATSSANSAEPARDGADGGSDGTP